MIKDGIDNGVTFQDYRQHVIDELGILGQAFVQAQRYTENRLVAEMIESLAAFKDPTLNPMDLNHEEASLVMGQNGIIPAVKAHRARTGAGLKESKEACDAYRIKHGWRAE